MVLNKRKISNVPENELFHGDAIKILKSLPDGSIDHCITDPPYNISGYDNKKKIGWLNSNSYWTKEKKFSKIDANWDKFTNNDYEFFTASWLKEVSRVLKPNGNIIIFGTYHSIYKIGSILDTMGKKIINSIVWYKRNAFPNVTQRMLCESTEYAIWAVNNSQKNAKNWVFNYHDLKKINGGTQMRNMWDIPSTPSSERKHGKHPSQKPVAVLNRLVIGASNKNEIILDPFVGSGTLPVVAKTLGRKFIGIDNEKKYLEIAKKRLAECESNLFA